MNFIWRLRKGPAYRTSMWHDSNVFPGVRYATRKMSLGQRIELLERARGLSQKNEFLRAGSASDEIEASLSDLLVTRLYLEWGLLAITGLRIDGVTATPALAIDRGPEALCEEIATVLRAEIGLTDDERKNS